MGNRTSTVINGVTTMYTVNNMNEYTSVDGVAYTYDRDGNLTSDGVNSYSYDSLDQMIGDESGGNTTEYSINAMGAQVGTNASGMTSQFLVDPAGSGSVAAIYNTSGNAVLNLRYGIGVAAESVAGQDYYLDFDASGSVADLSGVTGSRVQSFAYRPFGEIILSTGTIANALDYGGEFGARSQASGDIRMRFRDYIASIGRYAEEDPTGLDGGDLNMYRYVGNDPVSYVDPNGTNPLAIAGLLIGGTLNVGIYTVTNWGSLSWGGAAGAAVSGGIQGFYIGATGGAGIFLNAGVSATAQGAGYTVKTLIDGGFEWGDLAKETGVGFITGLVPGSSEVEELKPLSWGLGAPQLKNLLLGANKHGFFLWASSIEDVIKDNFEKLGEKIADWIAKTVNAFDPNALYGPAGFGASNFVADTGDSTFSYQVDYENAAAATAPAQEVTITDQLDSNLDWSTFQLAGVGWGNFFLTIPAGSQSYQTTQSMTYMGQTFNVEVQAGIHTSTGQVYATFQSIDPNTGLPPASPLIGFLPPEDGTGRGDGYLRYSVSPKGGIATGTQIRNIADITFDSGTTLATNLVNDEDPSQGTDPTKEALVTIDGVAPSSAVAALPSVSGSDFPVSWSGNDDASGSGIGSYTIYVSDNGGPFTPWLTNTSATGAFYSGVDGHSYGFYSTATDNAGNHESAHASADATTTVNAPASAADLTVSFASGFPAAVIGGAKQKVSIRIANDGNKAAVGTTDLQLVMSQNSTFVPGDTPVLTIGNIKLNLKPGKSKVFKETFNFAQNMPDGTYFILAYINGKYTVLETSTANNSAASAAVTVARGFVDLAATLGALPATFTAGKKGSVTINIADAANLAAKGSVVLTVALASDAQGDNAQTLVEQTKTVNLKTGKSKPFKLTFTIPKSQTAQNYFVIGTIAPASSIGDDNAVNNTVTSSAAIEIIG